MAVARFPAGIFVPASTPDPRRPARPWSWLAGLSWMLATLLRRLRAALPGGRSAAIQIAVLCDIADPVGQRRLRGALRAGLRGAERGLAAWPDLAITVAVLETVGTPGRVGDLGALVAACRVRRRPDGPHAVIRLATVADGRPLTDNNRLTALWLVLDWLLDWQPDDGDCFTVPYLAAPATAPRAVPAPSALGLPSIPPLPADAAIQPPAPVSPITAAAAVGASANGVAAPSADPPPGAPPIDGLAWPEESEAAGE